ncbi:YjcZ family sporulation protein [Aquibacillus rhizosphaerae]|uniref:YjcZ family sporulation protein n=1 Tax=Aquibacillus rhizosphaerae TaxID=3051431 RepID=A0ABT7LBD8_9BACI|nr:YjcZ family sporulation protein [Aquibacillus sp. LR5S19]MDL4842719.1 YjcZ family sporulation protein [Aquibacillus sp. LR5S19]
MSAVAGEGVAGGYGSGFALIVVLFILLIIVGSSWFTGGGYAGYGGYGY